jgi:hypothetical protein
MPVTPYNDVSVCVSVCLRLLKPDNDEQVQV